MRHVPLHTPALFLLALCMWFGKCSGDVIPTCPFGFEPTTESVDTCTCTQAETPPDGSFVAHGAPCAVCSVEDNADCVCIPGYSYSAYPTPTPLPPIRCGGGCGCDSGVLAPGTQMTPTQMTSSIGGWINSDEYAIPGYPVGESCWWIVSGDHPSVSLTLVFIHDKDNLIIEECADADCSQDGVNPLVDVSGRPYCETMEIRSYFNDWDCSYNRQSNCGNFCPSNNTDCPFTGVNPRTILDKEPRPPSNSFQWKSERWYERLPWACGDNSYNKFPQPNKPLATYTTTGRHMRVRFEAWQYNSRDYRRVGFTSSWDSGTSYGCQVCKAGTYKTRSGICSPCEAGTYKASEGYGGCIACEAGTYASEMYSVSCAVCPANSTSVAGSTSCQCVAGTYNENDGHFRVARCGL